MPMTIGDKYYGIKLFLVIVYVGLLSCHLPETYSSFEEYNSVKNLDQLTGLFDLKLGKTTITDIKKIFKPKYYLDKFIPDYHWGYYNLDIINDSDRKIIEKAINENHKNVSQFYYNKYEYDEMVVENVSLFFFDSILVGIYIKYPGFGFNLPEYFIEKYGDGVGSKKIETYSKWNDFKKCHETTSSFDEEIREWDNDVINVIYYKKLTSNKYTSRSDTIYYRTPVQTIKEYTSYDNYMFYTLKDKYKLFDELMRNAIESEKKALRTQKAEKLNSLI